MRVLNFTDGPTQMADASADLTRLQWLDFTRSDTLQLGRLESLLHPRHRSDLMNSLHAPLFEATDDYELIILRSIDQRAELIEPKTRAIAFLLCDNTVFTVHDADDSTLDTLFERLNKRRKKPITELLSLVHSLFNEIADGFLDHREPFSQRATEWQQRLLDPNDPFNDWNIIMQAKSSLGRMNTQLQLQKEALSNWQTSTRYAFNASLMIRFNDLHEHLARVERFADSTRADLIALTQVYFASTAQRTNVIIQFLAVISAIFLPLNLIAGLFGMNFASIPYLQHPAGPYLVVACMVLLTVLLLWWFKKKRWY